MGSKVGICLFMGVLLSHLSASAQSSESGLLRQKVIDSLTAVAKGSCPESLMNPVLLDACEQQLGRTQARLRELGAIKEARYRGKEPLPNGVEAEVYRVIFVNGQMTWMAGAGPNGKLSILYSQG